MKLERKFTVDLKDSNNYVSDEGNFSSVYKIRDDNGEIYCGKLPNIQKINHLLLDDSKKFKKKMKKFKLEKFTNCSLYEAGVAKDIWSRFNLAMKPEGVFLAKVEGVEDLFLPTFVNELAVDMDPKELNFSEYKKYLEAQDSAFAKVLKDGYYMWQDASWDKNCFYSGEKGFKFNDFALWGKYGYFNKYLLTDGGTGLYFKQAVEFAEKKKKELGLI